MIIIGVDFHPEFQQIACVDTESGESEERRLQHREEAERFYRELAARGVAVRVGLEASGHARWLEHLLKELQFELWIGDADEIQTKRLRKQKTDRQDAQLILKLLLEDRFPRIWVPSADNRDVPALAQAMPSVSVYASVLRSGAVRRGDHLRMQPAVAAA
jgi:transposase